jgi:ubiquinone/menaquinone biosynthesis C-methylase UbiE
MKETESLDFTGERFTPECIREIRYEHLHRYALVAGWIKGFKVLDAACGEGYGSNFLAAQAAEVTGIDVSSEAIAHARSRYSAPNLEFLEADCCKTSFADGSFDCIISFETLEHLHDQQGLLTEFRRLLKPKGFLVISTPDKAIYSDKMGNENSFHVSELYKPEFEALLAGFFPAVQLLGQKLGFHSMVWPLHHNEGRQVLIQQEKASRIECMQRPSSEPVYLLAICANSTGDMPNFDQSLFLFSDESESVYQHYYHEIRRNMETGAILQHLESRVDTLLTELAAAREANKNDLTKATKKNWLSRLLQRVTG